MTNSVQDRIKQKLFKMNLKAQSVSLQAGLSKDAVRKLLANPDQMPSSKALSGLARALEVSEQWLLTGEGPESQPEISLAVAKPLPTREMMPNDVEVKGTAAGSHIRGAFHLSSDPVDYVRRPPSLVSAKDVYALYVEGTSMEPQFSQGDLIYLHPHRPPKIGDAVVVQCQNGSADYVEATLGVYLRKTAEWIIIKKHNPVSEIQIARQTVLAIHKVLTLNEIFGV